nr:MAG TPA: hypothetical protein [Caudoviricetes sp.]
MRPPIMESLYFLALILCPYYSVSKCTLFDTASTPWSSVTIFKF